MNAQGSTQTARRGPATGTRLGALGAFLAALLALAAVLASSAPAYEPIEPGFDKFDVTPTDSKAGGHPNVSVDFEYRIDSEGECESNCLFGRRSGVHWPEGFIGNPHVAPRCSLTEFLLASCPSDSQIGIFNLLGLGSEGIYVALYNLETNPKQAGLLGFQAPLLTIPIFLELSGRTQSDYGLDAISTPQVRLPFNHLEVVLWGVPASEDNAAYRFVTPIEGAGFCAPGFEPGEVGCPPSAPFGSETYAPATVPPAPFLQNPTTCGVPLTVTGEIEYYGGAVGYAEQPWPETTSCNQASFTPSVTAKPTTSWADTATGLDSKLKVPQTQSPITPAPSEVRKVKVTLPEGFTINPGAADGKVACPDALSAIGTKLPASCPEFSKIGTLNLDIAALPEPIPGALYLAEPKPGEPYRVLLTASGFATNVKLLGRADTDPATGRVSVVFEDLPQSPLQEFDLHVFGSERGLFATPSHCGTYTVETEFVPWNGALNTRHSTNLITIDAGPNGTLCPVGPRPLAPVTQAGVSNNTAGNHVTFSFGVSRADGEQNLSGINVTTPPGFAATLAGVPYCPEASIALASSSARDGLAEIASSSCPAASQIGTAVAGAGAGTHPVYTGGKVYLAGPYKGAPLSLFAVIPAVSGPYDLGNVAVRAAITVDPVTAQVTTISDPLPQILDGIVLRARTVQVNLDRPNFAINPTNCSPFDVQSTVYGSEGGLSTRAIPFQVANCADLNFGPKLGIKLRGSTKRRGHPSLRAVLRTGDGEANLRRTVAVMPKNELLDNSHIGTVCTRVQFAADRCPAGSIYGSATAYTPLLDNPLHGNVYLRSGNHQLPDLVADLRGQFDIEVSAQIDSVQNGRLRARFNRIPDAPVSKFVLDMKGGKKGLLVNSKSLCRVSKMARLAIIGQNNARIRRNTKLQTGCGKSKASKRHLRRSRVVR